MNKVLAQTAHNLGEFNRAGLGPIANFNLSWSGTGALSLFNLVISNIIGIMTIVAGLWFIFQFIIGAFQYLTSGGDKAKTQEAQQKITMALVGLVVVVAAIFIIDLVGALLGIDILKPGSLVSKMWG